MVPGKFMESGPRSPYATKRAPSVLDDEGEAPPSTAAIAVGLFRDNFFKLEPEQTKGHFQSQMTNRLLLKKSKQIDRGVAIYVVHVRINYLL